MDEVHERSLDSDFLLVLTKQLLLGTPNLKVILMSATLDSQRVQTYFLDVLPHPPPILTIPGFTHPVRDIYLEEIYRQEMVSFDGVSSTLKELLREGESNASKEGEIDYGLLRKLILYVDSDEFASKNPGPAQGSVLVFLPGVGEITRLLSELKSASSALWVLPLHGALSGNDQSLVFRRPPSPYSKKVVLATNVAETSITIPDVTVVIDTGRVKESGYDPQTRMACLVEGWCSQDSMRQRRGRAGRVQAGVCFHLLTTPTFHSLPLHSPPEVLRTPLEQMVLQIMTMFSSSSSSSSSSLLSHPSTFLSLLLDPPEAATIRAALSTLEEIQAVVPKGDELRITPLGRHLAALPCPVRLGKMLIYGALLGVLTPALAIAACMLVRNPLLSLQFREDRQEVETARVRRLGIGGSFGKSDHLLLARAVEAYLKEGGREGRRALCQEVGLSFERMCEVQTLISQLGRDMSSLGFPPAPSSLSSTRVERGGREGGSDGARALLATMDEKGGRAYWRLVKAAVGVGLYPNVVKVVRPPFRYAKVAGGAVQVEAHARELSFYVFNKHKEPPVEPLASFYFPHKDKEDRVYIHPCSINYSQGAYTVPWLVFSDVMRTTRAFVRDCTEVSPYALLLAANTLRMQHDISSSSSSSSRPPSSAASGTLLLEEEGWIRFAAVGRIGALVNALKRKVDELLEEKVRNPELELGDSPAARALVKLIATDGMG